MIPGINIIRGEASIVSNNRAGGCFEALSRGFRGQIIYPKVALSSF